MRHIGQLSYFLLLTLLSTMSSADLKPQQYSVVILDFHDPGYFKIDYEGKSLELWFHYKTFPFEYLDSISSRFPMSATVTIDKEGQQLTLDDQTRNLVIGTQLSQVVVDKCYEDASTTYDYVICSSNHLSGLSYQRQGLISYLDRSDLETELRELLTRVKNHQELGLQIHRELLDYMGSTRDLGSIFNHQYYEEQFLMLESHINQLNFILDKS